MSSSTKFQSHYMTVSSSDYEKLYPEKDEQWTSSRVLGNIYKLYDIDQDRARKMYSDFKYLQTDPSSKYYNPYSTATNQAVTNLQSMGFDTSVLDDNWLNNNRSAVQANLIYNGTTNTPSKPGKKATEEQWASYWIYKYYENEGQTKKAEEEWQAAQNEAKYLAGRTDLNYSDDQIMAEVNKNFASKYPTLAKMRENQFDPVQLNRAVSYSDDALRGSIWEARNPDYTGDLEGAMAYSYLGRGNQWEYNAETAAKLNKGDVNTYAPYSVGMTGAKTNAAGLYFNMPSFNQDWLDQNRERILNGNDEQAKKHYNDVREAELTTQQAESELAELNSRVEKWVSQGLSEDRIERNIDQLLESSEFSTLRKMDNSIKTGMDEDVLNLTRSVPYRRADIVQSAMDRVAMRDGKDDKNKTLAKLQIPEMNEYGRKQQERWAKEHSEGKDEVVTDTPAAIAPQTPGEKLTEEAQNRNATSVISILYGSFTPSEQKHFDAQPLINGEKTAQDLYNFKTSKVGGGTQTKNYGPYNPEIFEDPTWASRMAAQLQQEADDKYSSVAYETLETRTNYETMQAYNAELAEENRMLTEEYQDLVLAHEPIPYEPSVQIGGDEGPDLHFVLQDDGTYTLDMNYDWENPAINEYLAMNNMTREDFDAEVAKQKAILDAKADSIRQAKEKTYQADPYAAAQQERFYDSLPDAKVVAAQLAQSEEYLAKNQADYEAANKAVESVDRRRRNLRKVMARSGVGFTDTSVLDNELNYVAAFTNYKSPQANADGTIGELEATFGGRDLTEEEAKDFHAYIDKLQENVDDAMFIADREETPENYKGWIGQYAEDTKKQIRMSNAYLMTKTDDFEELARSGEDKFTLNTAANASSPGAKESYGDTKIGWPLMTDLEKKIYYALYAKEGLEAADEFYNDLDPSLLIRSKEGLSRNAEARAKSGFFGRLANLAIDIGLAAAEVPASLMYLAGSALQGEGDQWLRIPSHIAKQSYGQTIEELHNLYKNKAPVFDTIITCLAEMIHNRGRSAVVAGMFGPLFPAGTNEVFMAMPIATTAMADALDEAFERGATPAQAWTLAAINFLAESVTEGIELKHMKRAFSAGSAGKNTIKDFLISRIPEGIQEMIGEVTNNIVERTADNIIMGEKSKHKAAVQAYIDQGYMPDDAENMVVMDEFKDDLHTALISFASSYLDLGAYGLGKIRSNWQYAKEVDNLRRLGDSTTTIHDLRVRDQKGAEAFQTALEKADEAALNKPLNPFFSNEEKAQAPKLTTEEQNAQQPEYDTDITILANSSESDQTTVTATLAAVLRTDDMNAEQAMAAAESLADVLGEDSIGSLMELWEGGVVSGTDINTLRLGLQYAALADGRCRAIMTGQAGNAYTMGTPDAKARIISEAVQQDMANPNVQEQVNSAVHEYRVAAVEHQLMAEDGPSNQLETANIKLADAENRMNIAADRLEKQRNVEAAAAEAVAEAGETMANDPSDENAKQLDRARQSQNSQAAVTQEYEQSEENARREERKVREETDKVAGEIRADLRQQAEEIVDQQDQERAEAAAQLAEQQRLAQEEAARQQAEEDERTGKAQEMREDAAIEGFVAGENLGEEEQEQRTDDLKNQRDKVKAVLTDLDQPLTNTEGMLALAAFERRLGIPIKFADLGPVNQQHITRGKYKDGVIYLNQNLVKEGKLTVGQALVEASLHEIIHSVRDTNSYNGYRDVVLQQMFGMDGSVDTQSLYQNNSDFRAAIDAMIEDRAAANDPNFTGDINQKMIDLAEEEIVADFARKNLAEKDVAQRLVDCGVGGKIRNALHNVNQMLKNYLSNMTGEERQTAENLRRAERNLQKAIDEAARANTHPEGSQFSISQFAESAGLSFDQDTLELRDKDDNVIDGVNYKVTADMMDNTPVGLLIDLARDGAKTKAGKDKFTPTISAETAQAQKQMFADLMNMVAQYRDTDLVWEIASSTMFSAMKSNSDPQYSTTVDFGTVCAKTQEIIDVMSRVMLEKGRGLTREEVLAVYNETANAGLTVPCPVCYVFSRWMGVPSLLNQMSQYQKRFVKLNEDGTIDVKATQKEASKYVKDALKKYGDKEGIDKAKISITNRMKTQEKNRTDALAVLNSETATADEKAKAQTKHDAAIKQLDALQKDLGEVEAYNWVTQALLDENGKVDPNFEITPDDVLFDLRRTGEFAKYAKNWTYRNTRGAGMGKAIMPYSGESIGDIIYGTTRKSAIQNPFLTLTPTKAADGIKNAVKRARQQNLIGGQRLQSTSDFRPEWGLDYMMAFLELQAVGSKVQMYTKVAEAVDLLASMGADVNLSIMGKGQGWHTDENGNAVLDFSDVTGMNYETAKALKDNYDNVQMILVGMNDTHIRLALANKDIDFVIPWHSSGNSKDTLSSLISSVGESLETSSDYTDTQSDAVSENQTAEQKKLWSLRMKILQGQKLTEEDRKIIYADKEYLMPLYERFNIKGKDDDCYQVKLGKDQAKQIFPYEYWNKSLTKDQANGNGQAFIDYCNHFGIVPRFSGVVKKNDDGSFSVTGNFAGAVYDENGNITGYDPDQMADGYWKVLIDRPMYDNNGNYRDQQVVDVTKAKIGALENGKLTGSDMPLTTSAMYGPNYSEQEKTAVDNSLAAIEQMEQARMNGGKQSVFGDLTQADQDLMNDAVTDYADAVERGDLESAKDDVDFYAKQAGYTEKVYHGTNMFGFTEFEGDAIFTAYDPSIAGTYSSVGNAIRKLNDSNAVNFKNMSNEEIVEYINSLSDDDKAGLETEGYEFVGAELTDDGDIRINMEDGFFGEFTHDEFMQFTFENAMLRKKNAGVYALYGKPGKQLVVDANGDSWNGIKYIPEGMETYFQDPARRMQGMTTGEIANYAANSGYDSVRINNVYDHGRWFDGNGYGDILIFLNNKNIKSADTVVYDDNGNMIPLDQRFTDSPDIRYSTEGELTQADMDLMSTPDNRNAIYVKDGHTEDGNTVDFISLMLDGVKKGETRNHKNITRKQWLGLAKDGQVYGRVRFGEPRILEKGTQDYADSMIEGTEYDIKDGETKYYYPIIEIDDFRDNPQPILQNGNYGKYSEQGDLTAADRDLMNTQAIADAGAISQDEYEAYMDRYHRRPLEAKKVWEGEAQRAFGDVGGMLQNSDEMSNFAKSVVQAQNSYFPDTNYEQINRAIDWIKSIKRVNPNSDGYAEALEKVASPNFDYRSADGQARMVAVMGLAVAKNDVLAQATLADSFNRQGTDLGRMLQARKLFKLMTPVGRITTLQKMLQNQSEEFKAKGIDIDDLKFSDWIYQAASVADTEEDFRKVQQAAAAELAQQLPVGWKDRLQSLRMLSMLANPRTHIRNVIGNMMFVPAVGLKNKIGALMELGLKKGERTKTLAPILPSDIRQFAIQDARAMQGDLTGEAKYDENTMIRQSQKPLGEIGSFLSDLNSKALENEDWFFLRGHYRKALGGWMVANGYTVEQVQNNPELLEKGREYAIQEAKKATYRDFNKAAAKLNSISREGGVGGFLVDAMLPFKKTPANILRRGVEYSPVGLARGLWGLAKGLHNGSMDANQVIDRISSGLSGSAVMALGFWLAGSGIVSGGLGDDDWLEKLKGRQQYSIKLPFKLFGKDVTYTMDWAAPMAMPFFVGAAVREMADKEGFDLTKAIGALSTITEPVFNLSMLDGVNSLLKTSSYADEDPFTQIGAKILANYATSYVPSVLGAITRTFFDDTQRKSYVRKSDKGKLDVNGTFHYAFETAQNKIPYASKANIPVRDVWGNAKTSEFAERLIENFISPGYIESYETDAVINELGRLWDATGNQKLEPQHAQAPNGTDFTAEQYDEYDRIHGETKYRMLNELVNNKAYQEMTNDDAKAEIISNIYIYATKVAKGAVLPDYEYEEETVESMIHDGIVSDYSNKMLDALKNGEMDTYEDCVQALYDQGLERKDIKGKISKKYIGPWKDAYTGFVNAKTDSDREKYQKEMDKIELKINESGFIDINIYGSGGWQSQVDKTLNNN